MSRLCTSARHLAAMARSATAAGLLALAALAGTGAAANDTPGHGLTPPKTEVLNIARVTWTVGDTIEEATAEARFTVAPEPAPPSPGTLTAFRHANGAPADLIEHLPFPLGNDVVQMVAVLSNAGTMPVAAGAATDGFEALHGADTSANTGTETVPVVRTDWLQLGEPLFVVLQDPLLSQDPTRRDRLSVTVSDPVTGDREPLELIETGIDTGIFTGVIATTVSPARHGDGRLASAPGAEVTVRHTDPFAAARDLQTAVVMRATGTRGRVFDSATGVPLNGVTVSLIDAATGQPAAVFCEQTGASMPATVFTGGTITDSEGRQRQLGPGEFAFPGALPGTYRFVVAPVDGYALPSQHDDAALAALPGGPHALAPGSRLEPFSIAAMGEYRIDIPADRLGAEATASLTREGSTNRAGHGDFVDFTVRFSPGQADVVTLTEHLPEGLGFVADTARLDGAPVSPRRDGAERALLLENLAVTPGGEHVLSYSAQVAPAARSGSSLRSTSTLTGAGLSPLSDDHRLVVEERFGRDRMTIVGEIVAGPCGAPDADRDLSGIRVLLQTGDRATTDAAGRFTLRDVPRATHVLALDAASLPPGARAQLCTDNTRRSGSALSQFVTAAPGLIARAQFHIVFDEAAEVAPDPGPASAWRAPEARDPVATYTATWLHAQPADSAPRVLYPPQGLQAQSGAVDLFYLRPSGARVEVWLNGRPVDQRRRDPSISNLLGTLHLERWRGLRLSEGRNTIRVIMTDEAGEEILSRTHEVFWITELELAEVLPESSMLETDGRSRPVVEMRLTDRQGRPLRPGATVSVTVAPPFAFAPGAAAPGAPAHDREGLATVQALVGADGVIRLELDAVQETATARFEIATRWGAVRRAVRISAAGRPWTVIGLAEGVIGRSGIRHDLMPGAHSVGDFAARTALFAEGPVGEDWTLTFRLDTARREATRDRDRDFYVFGDNSRQDHLAESRGPLHIHLRREGEEYLWGDFRTGIKTDLVSFDRALTGARAVYRGDRAELTLFAASTDREQVEDRLVVDGTMGPYRLSRGNIRPGSETVRLLVVARGDATRELASERLSPGRDYRLDRRTGRMTLLLPVPAFTPDLDRHVLVVTYETDERLPRGWVAGGRLEASPHDHLRLGATVLAASQLGSGEAAGQLLGVDVEYEASDELTLGAEVVQTRKRLSGDTAHGTEVDLRAHWDDGVDTADARLRHAQGARGFDASPARGSHTLGTLEFSKRLRPGADGPRSGLFLDGGLRAERDRATGLTRAEAEALLVRRAAGVEWGAGLGLRHRRDAGGRSDWAVLMGRAGWTSEDGRIEMAVDVEAPVHRRGTGAAQPGRLQLSARHRMTETATTFATLSGAHEADARSGLFAAGVELAPWTGTRLTGGLAHAGAAGGTGFFGGIDQRFDLGEGREISLGLDAQTDIGIGTGLAPLGATEGLPFESKRFVTLRAGVRQDTETWSASAELQGRTDAEGQSIAMRLVGHGEVDAHWTVGGEFYAAARRGERRGHDLDLHLGAAHRAGPDDPLTLVQLEIERSESADDTRRTEVYGSVHHARYLSSVESLTARYGTRFSRHSGGGGQSNLTSLIGVEYRHDVTERMDIGLQGALMHSTSGGDVAASFGVSLGFTAFEGGWFGLGYNFRGFSDRAFSQSGETRQGAFLQFRLKLDGSNLGAGRS